MTPSRLVAGLAVAVAAGLAVGAPDFAEPTEAEVHYCGHGTDYDLRHPHFRLEFVDHVDHRGGHSHRVLFHRQMFGDDDWTTDVACPSDDH